VESYIKINGEENLKMYDNMPSFINFLEKIKLPPANEQSENEIKMNKTL
jgi:hypothetical protein